MLLMLQSIGSLISCIHDTMKQFEKVDVLLLAVSLLIIFIVVYLRVASRRASLVVFVSRQKSVASFVSRQKSASHTVSSHTPATPASGTYGI
jgi:hypothetical protein